MAQRPNQSETHSSTFPQDSDSDSESEVELRSTHTSLETTTSDESDGTLVDGHSQLLVGTLPLTDKDPPESPEDKNPPLNSSVEGLASGFSEGNTGDLSRAKKLATTPLSEKFKQVVDTLHYHRKKIPLLNTLHKINQKPLLILEKAWR